GAAREPGANACRPCPRAARWKVCAVAGRCAGAGTRRAAPPHGAQLRRAGRRRDARRCDRPALPALRLSVRTMAASTQRRARAEALAARLPPLLVAARQVAATVEQGIHGRRRVGIGETFWQFRRYEPGDAPNRIDWRQTAKSDRIYVREHEWAAAQTVWLWRDASPSMRFTSDPQRPDKRDTASVLVLALAAMLLRAGERVGLLGSDARPVAGASALDRLVGELDRLEATDDSLPPLRSLARHAPIVLVGDFLSPLATIDARLRAFAEDGRPGHMVQML